MVVAHVQNPISVNGTLNILPVVTLIASKIEHFSGITGDFQQHFLCACAEAAM